MGGGGGGTFDARANLEQQAVSENLRLSIHIVRIFLKFILHVGDVVEFRLWGNDIAEI